MSTAIFGGVEAGDASPKGEGASDEENNGGEFGDLDVGALEDQNSPAGGQTIAILLAGDFHLSWRISAVRGIGRMTGNYNECWKVEVKL